VSAPHARSVDISCTSATSPRSLPRPRRSVDRTRPNPSLPVTRPRTFLCISPPYITSEKVRAGQYTYYDYYDASEDTGSFEDERVLYGYGP
jgi:hypothetical protein